MPLKDIAKQHGAVLLGSRRANEDFPLLIKVLFPREKLSVQVHPDDALAQKFGEPRGKTECWYALDAEPDAQVALGVRPGVTMDQISGAVQDQSLESLLEMVPVRKGDMLFVDAGTVHAMGPGVVILETQQTSDLTYRLYDYGRPRELHLEKSFAAIRMATHAGKIQPRSADGHSILIDERYFRVERWPLPAGTAPSLAASVPTVQMLFVAEGTLRISGPSFEPFSVERNQLAVIPASAPSWKADTSQPAEIVRILPAIG
jgi:mannose-6-phosphate isomerase